MATTMTTDWERRPSVGGLIALAGGAVMAIGVFLPWVTGPKQAKEIIFNGMDRIPAAEALRLGMINRVVANGTELEAALARFETETTNQKVVATLESLAVLPI